MLPGEKKADAEARCLKEGSALASDAVRLGKMRQDAVAEERAAAAQTKKGTTPSRDAGKPVQDTEALAQLTELAHGHKQTLAEMKTLQRQLEEAEDAAAQSKAEADAAREALTEERAKGLGLPPVAPRNAEVEEAVMDAPHTPHAKTGHPHLKPAVSGPALKRA